MNFKHENNPADYSGSQVTSNDAQCILCAYKHNTRKGKGAIDKMQNSACGGTPRSTDKSVRLLFERGTYISLVNAQTELLADPSPSLS